MPVPPGYPGFPDRDIQPVAPHAEPCGSYTRDVDVHGSLDGVKDVSSISGERAFRRAFGVSAYASRTLTTFPSSAEKRLAPF